MDNATLELKKISFNKEEKRDFVTVLKARVNHYFDELQLSQKADRFMYLKSLVLMGIVALNYAAILSISGPFAVIGLYILLGLTISVGTMNISHDALHGAYTSNSFSNRLLGFVMDLLSGPSSFYWKKGHTIDHHTYTNIADHDADLKVPIILRLCPDAPYRTFHRFQHLYAPILYSLNFFHWIYISDLKRIYQAIVHRKTLVKQPGYKQPSVKELILMVTFKLTHLCLLILVPIALLPVPWWQVVVGYFAFLFTAGLTLTIIFQLAHIVEHVDFPMPDDAGKIENSFAKHQLATTSNFAMQNKLVTFLIGGLNFQIEHHLFPQICHTHLHKIAPIVQATAEEFGLAYHYNSSFCSAVKSHFKTLKTLGHTPPA